MISFPNAKINIGLNITERRADGYHNLETVFYPIQVSDVLEVIEADVFCIEAMMVLIFCSSGKISVLS